MPTDEGKVAALQDLYAKGTLTAEDVRRVMDGPDGGLARLGNVLRPDETPVRFVPPARAQKFFEDLRHAASSPHFGGPQKDWTRELLNRAEEAGLFKP